MMNCKEKAVYAATCELSDHRKQLEEGTDLGYHIHKRTDFKFPSLWFGL